MLQARGCPAELDQLIDGTLPTELETDLARHLDNCLRCRQELSRRTEWSVADFLGGPLPVPGPPDATLDRVIRQLKAEMGNKTSFAGDDGASLVALAG